MADTETGVAQKRVYSATTEVDTLREWTTALDAVVEEARVHLYEGLRVRAIDPANVMQVEVEVDDEVLDVHRDPQVSAGLNVEKLHQVVQTFIDEDTVEVEFDAEEKHLSVETILSTFETATIDTHSIRSDPDPGPSGQEVSFGLEDSHFEYALDLVDEVSDQIWIRMDPDEETVTFESDGDIDNSSVTLRSDSLFATNWGEAVSLYPIDYLRDIAGTVENGTGLIIGLATDYPLCARWEKHGVEARFYLAPQVRS